jgi:hypothetical protein
MPMDDKAKEKVRKAVNKFLETRDKFRAQRRSAVGEINTAEKAALGAIFAQVAKLDVTKEAFKQAVTFEQHIRDARGVPEKVTAEGDMELSGGFANVILATGTAFEPVLSEKDREAQESAVYKAEADAELHGEETETEGGADPEPSDDKVTKFSGRRGAKESPEETEALKEMAAS